MAKSDVPKAPFTNRHTQRAPKPQELPLNKQQAKMLEELAATRNATKKAADDAQREFATALSMALFGAGLKNARFTGFGGTKEKPTMIVIPVGPQI